MSESVWLPALIALGIGLIGGAFAALRLARSGRGAEKEATGTNDRADSELRLADLEARRDDLYRQLASEALSDADRGELELAAARALRSIDELSGEVGRSPRPVSATVEPASRQPAAAPRSPIRAALIGFTSGAVAVGLIGMLIFWASRDATPRPDDGAMAPAAAATDDPHADGSELPPQLAARYSQLQQALAVNPDDLASHREAAQLLLTGGQLIGAFQHAQEVERLAPEDPDGLYVQAIVRMTIGQDEQALGLIDRVISMDLARIPAYIVRGVIQLRMGDRDGGIETWERGLAMAGGRHPALDHFLSMAREGASTEEILSTPPGSRPTPPAAPQSAPAAAQGPAYRVRVDLAEGVDAPTRSILFVSLRGPDPGPPAAVKRIENPRFPLDLTLSAADTMLGRPMPTSGVLAARLDTDGNASTRTPDEPQASTQAEAGSSIELVLTPAG